MRDKTRKIWQYIKDDKTKERADECHAAQKKYELAIRDEKGYNRKDIKKYRDGKREWDRAKAQIEKRTKGEPIQIPCCTWCGEDIDDISHSSSYCSGDHVGWVGRIKMSKCQADYRQSTNGRTAVSTIEAVCKIIEQKYKCFGKCKSYQYPHAFTQDHWIPRTDGGSDDNSNIKMLCHQCNSSKGSRDGDDWLSDGDGWDCMASYGLATAIFNLSLYCEHLHLKNAVRG